MQKAEFPNNCVHSENCFFSVKTPNQKCAAKAAKDKSVHECMRPNAPAVALFRKYIDKICSSLFLT